LDGFLHRIRHVLNRCHQGVPSWLRLCSRLARAPAACPTQHPGVLPFEAMKITRRKTSDDLAHESHFDYSKSKPNRFAPRSPRSAIAIVLDADVANVFRDASESTPYCELRLLLSRDLVPGGRANKAINPTVAAVTPLAGGSVIPAGHRASKRRAVPPAGYGWRYAV